MFWMKSLLVDHRWLAAALLLFCGLLPASPADAGSSNADEIVKKVLARAQTAREDARRAGYAYTKHVVVQDLDNQGRVTETKEKLFKFSSGLGSLEQIKVNGQSLGADRLKKEEERVAQQEQHLVDSKSAKRDDHWEKYLTPDLASRYQYTLLERTVLNGRPTWVIGFQPASANLPVHQMADRLLNQLAGKIWVDEQEFEIARAELSSQSKIALGGMLELLGSLKRFSYVLERIRVEEGIWFNRLAKGDFEGRKLLDSTHVKTRSETSGFHRIEGERRG